jgi:hypothetical protein
MYSPRSSDVAASLTKKLVNGKYTVLIAENVKILICVKLISELVTSPKDEKNACASYILTVSFNRNHNA